MEERIAASVTRLFAAALRADPEAGSLTFSRRLVPQRVVPSLRAGRLSSREYAGYPRRHMSPERPQIEKPEGESLRARDRGHRRRRRRRGDARLQGHRPLRRRRLLDRGGVRRVVGSRAALRVQARQGPRDPGLGCWRLGHEGRRPPQAHDPVRDGLRRAGCGRRDPSPHEPLVFVVDLLSVDLFGPRGWCRARP